MGRVDLFSLTKSVLFLLSLCKYINLYKCIEATREDKTLYKSPCIFSLNFCCCSEDFNTPGITRTLNNLPLPVKHCKFLLWGMVPAAMKGQGRTHKWVHCEHMLPCSQTFILQDMDNRHCGSMVPILSKLFLICWFLMTQQHKEWQG